jgi:hypothetical protein
MSTSFIPSNAAAYNIFYKNICQYVAQMTSGTPPKWTHIPADRITALNDGYAEWYTAYAKTLTPHPPEDTTERNRVYRSTKKTLQEFIAQFLRFFPVTDEDRDNMGIPNKKPRRKEIPVPKTAPRLIPDTRTRRRIKVGYMDEGSSRRGKPADVHGIEICWAILDHYPVDLSELVHSSFDTKPPLILDFEEHQRGRHVYMVGRWEIEREGLKGPPGAVEDVIIP